MEEQARAQAIVEAYLADADQAISARPGGTPPPRRSVQSRRDDGRFNEDLIAADRLLHESIRALPENYNFEIVKTVRRIRRERARRVALQLPEGLQMFACTLADIFRRFGWDHDRDAEGCEVVILGDVTYGACCVDDQTAAALGCDFLVHYGHSCLVPVSECAIRTMYVFVDIRWDVSHLVACVQEEFREMPAERPRLTLVSTIQFASALGECAAALRQLDRFAEVEVPQARPLSPGELLGCTAPIIDEKRPGESPAAPVVLLYVGDGRFHLESVLIHNPGLARAYRYDPYSKVLTRERYDLPGMMEARLTAIRRAARPETRRFGLIFGTLGRQGNPRIVQRLQRALRESGKHYVTILCSEVSPQRLRCLARSGIEAWIQVACPRLSIDWGEELGPDGAPVLTPYEALVALGKTPWRYDRYPMDYYAKNGGEWSNYHRE
ncbi:hypothetical protein CDCA_CDCA01G0442 [Cyanidium caldarium]|uniref:2-(3-amino-3-carboxypropyl)histidine synthase subunit 1 n=1 Tax=Cyanidium caldarium TaxID=2771 RepID=A0AAV9IPY8_CYACA|nr:hypothetical protein CDCA_CDCA01G0442 [Cyanidium caldarium]